MFYLTAKTKQGLENKIADLEKKVREINLSFAEVVDSSSWHDNFDFDQTQQRRDFYEHQLVDFKEKLKDCQIIKPNGDTETIGLGHKITLDDGKHYILVGELDSDPAINFVSYLSPFGKQLVGKKPGDILTDGRKITAISPADL